MFKGVFKIPEVDINKLTGKGVILVIIIMVCYAGASLVRGLIEDRIERSDYALNSLKGIKEYVYNPLATYSDKNNQATKTQVFDNVKVVTKNISTKSLGKQKYSVYEVDVLSTGLIGVTFNPKSHEEYTIQLPEGVNAESISIKLDGLDSSDYFYDNTKRVLIINADSLINKKEISLAYRMKGINRILFSSVEDRTYYASIITNTKNIKLLNSGNTIYNPDGNQVDITVSPFLENSGIKYLSSSDDINFVDRIVKYAILLIIMVFALMFFVDLKKGLSANIFQYFLVGISLSLFYLLTLSLGEHIGYLKAYIMASIVTAFINGWYTLGVFASKKTGYLFSVMLIVLYTIMYYLTKITSVNLLLGTVLLYVILLIFMISTRGLNVKK